MELAIKGTEGGFQAQDSISEEEEVKNMRKTVADDPRMKEIKRAVLIPKFGNKFQIQNPNIPLKDLKADNQRFLRQPSTKSYPLFGLPVVRAVIRAADNDVVHQGAEAILKLVEKEKYLFYEENGDPLNHNATVDKHIQGCSDCSEIEEIKSKVPSTDKSLLQIPKNFEDIVLIFADRRHRGLAEAYKRIKSWADFPNLKRKVLLQLTSKAQC